MTVRALIDTITASAADTDDWQQIPECLWLTREPYLIVVMDGGGIPDAVQNARFANYLEECMERAQRR